MIVAVLPFMIQIVEPSERLTFAIWLLCRFENTSESSGIEYWMLFRWHMLSLILQRRLRVDDRLDRCRPARRRSA